MPPCRRLPRGGGASSVGTGSLARPVGALDLPRACYALRGRPPVTCARARPGREGKGRDTDAMGRTCRPAGSFLWEAWGAGMSSPPAATRSARSMGRRGCLGARRAGAARHRVAWLAVGPRSLVGPRRRDEPAPAVLGCRQERPRRWASSAPSAFRRLDGGTRRLICLGAAREGGGLAWALQTSLSYAARVDDAGTLGRAWARGVKGGWLLLKLDSQCRESARLGLKPCNESWRRRRIPRHTAGRPAAIRVRL